MSNDLIQIHDVENDEVIVRELTDAEQAERDAEVAAWIKEKEIKQAKAEADAAAKAALLEKLGITEEQAKLLLS